MNKVFQIVIIFCLAFAVSGYGQSNPNPCNLPNVNCVNGGGNGIITSFNSTNIVYTTPGRSVPFWIAFGDTITNDIDTSNNNNYSLTVVSGPGTMNGLQGGFPAKYVYFNDITFSEFGDYVISILRSGGTARKFNLKVLPDVDFCTESPAGSCASYGGNQIFVQAQFGSVIPVDAVFPNRVGVIDSVTGKLDSSFVGTIYAQKVSGPGILYGTLSMSGKKWFDFDNLRFTETGVYTIKFYEESENKYEEAIVEVEVVAANNTQRVNLSNTKVYPNPFTDILQVEVQQNNDIQSLTIFDSTGKIIVAQKQDHKNGIFSINTSSFSTGLYVLSIQTSTGIEKRILVKQK